MAIEREIIDFFERLDTLMKYSFTYQKAKMNSLLRLLKS